MNIPVSPVQKIDLRSAGGPKSVWGFSDDGEFIYCRTKSEATWRRAEAVKFYEKEKGAKND